jgi:DNA-directed RNA polymerase subunit H (RpoH/RPB5)
MSSATGALGVTNIWGGELLPEVLNVLDDSKVAKENVTNLSRGFIMDLVGDDVSATSGDVVRVVGESNSNDWDEIFL